MYNIDMPTRAELPTSRQLVRSTLCTIAIAAVLLVTIVLPAEYAVDPTGIGRALGLTEMGEIKGQLQREAEADRLRDQAAPMTKPVPAPERRSGLFERTLEGLLIAPARAQGAPAPAATKNDEMSLTLAPARA